MAESGPSTVADGRAGAKHPARIAVLVLAAGEGRRFDPGRTAAKLIAPLDGEPVLVHTVGAMLDTFGHCHVVLREAWRADPGLSAVAGRLLRAGATLWFCPDAQRGMGHSLAFGVTCLGGTGAPDAVLVALGDMPWVRPATLRALCDRVLSPSLIAAPVHAGRRGHPVLFGREHLPALSTLTGDEGARDLLRQHPITAVPVDDPGVLRDVDAPEDLAAATAVPATTSPSAPPALAALPAPTAPASPPAPPASRIRSR